MNMRLTFFIASLLFLAASCAKPSDTTDTSVMLIGKWNVNNTLEKQNNRNPPQVISYTGSVNDYMTFQRDGNVSFSVNGNLQTRKYTILSNQWLKLDADSFMIVQLMADRLTLYRNNIPALNEYTVNLSK